MNIGDRIRTTREAKLVAGKRMTQSMLAKEIGISREAISQWENGQTKGLKPENLLACSKILGVDIEWLISGNRNNNISGSPVELLPALKLDITEFAFKALDQLYDKGLREIQGARWTAERFNKIYRLKVLKPELTLEDLVGVETYLEI